MNILIINGNPKKDSFCSALAESYQRGCETTSYSVKLISLGDLVFDPVLRDGYFGNQVIEPDLQLLIAAIDHADHIVFVYPNWWGAMPALLKGALDRVFVPGFAFKFEGKGITKMLTGKSASLLITMDVPIWMYRWVHGSRGVKLMRENILDFCGVKCGKPSFFGPVHKAKAKERERWLERAFSLGQSVTGSIPALVN